LRAISGHPPGQTAPRPGQYRSARASQRPARRAAGALQRSGARQPSAAAVPVAAITTL